MLTRQEQVHSEFDRFYKAFEDRFRGSRELIKSRAKDYLPFLLPARELHGTAAALDLGCGRGEWLELLGELGFDARGVDINVAMLEEPLKLGLNVLQEDALTALRDVPTESQSIVSSFHLVEHLPFDDVLKLVRDAMRVLVPGGLLILETPNPENVRVATHTFYLDPTHRNPLPPELLGFVAQYMGFGRTKILRLREDPKLPSESPLGLEGVMDGAGRDYGLVAQKAADASVVSLFDRAFEAEHSVGFLQLVRWFDQQRAADDLKRDNQVALLLEAIERTENAVGKIKALLGGGNAVVRHTNAPPSAQVARADGVAQGDQPLAGHSSEIERLRNEVADLNRERQGMAVAAADLQLQVDVLKRSTSWRITAPLRWISRSAKHLAGKAVARRQGAVAERPWKKAWPVEEAAASDGAAYSSDPNGDTRVAIGVDGVEVKDGRVLLIVDIRNVGGTVLLASEAGGSGAINLALRQGAVGAAGMIEAENRVPLPHNLPPGQQARVHATFQIPANSRGIWHLDVVCERVAWLSTKGCHHVDVAL